MRKIFQKKVAIPSSSGQSFQQFFERVYTNFEVLVAIPSSSGQSFQRFVCSL